MTIFTAIIGYFVIGFTVSTIVGIFYKQINKYKLYCVFSTFDRNFEEFHFWFWLVVWPMMLFDLILGIIFTVIGSFFKGSGSILQNYLNYITNIIK